MRMNEQNLHVGMDICYDKKLKHKIDKDISCLVTWSHNFPEIQIEKNYKHEGKKPYSIRIQHGNSES